VSFPGGKVEQSDDNLAHTALREVHEEIGVSPQSIAIIGKLTEVYIPVSNFYVHPFVGYLTEKPNFTPQPNEVQQIIEVPLEWLLDKNNQTTTNLTLPNGIELKSVPCFRIEGDIIWGATAMLLKELITIIEQVRQ
jgi:8-oxo-dGTP pyrophosphatase MutT (NUDIX family)